MEYQIQVTRVDAQPTAVVRCRTSQNQLSKVVPELCGEVWTFLRAGNFPRPGRHVAVYFDGEMNIEVGAEVFQHFAGNDRVLCSATPAGLVATTAHIGPYNRLGDAHNAVCQWCKDNGYTLAGPSWEVYGHWTDDVTKLRTDVFWLVKPRDG
jgi:effector-binding domain-containing protein